MIFLIAFLALAMRCIAYPFATADSADPTSRIWSAWSWLSDPELINHGVWGPLHTYLIAFSLLVYPDPVVAPVVLHIAFSVASSVLLFLFVRSEFADHATSVAIAVAYAFYPVAIVTSLVATSEGPFVFFLLLSALFLSLARRAAGSSLKYGAAAGVALTLAGMLRYEGWMLIPLLGVMLWRKPKVMLVFLAASMIHPLFWMIGNGIHHGDPLYPITWASNWELNMEGVGERLDRRAVLRRLVFYPGTTLIGMTPVVALLALAGAAIAVVRRKSCALWLIPCVGLMVLLVLPAARGSLAMKMKYTATLGTLFYPFAAVSLMSMGALMSTPRRRWSVGILLALSSIAFSYPTALSATRWIPLREYHRLPEIDAIPRLSEPERTKELAAIVNEAFESENDGFISDFYGYHHSFYVALLTRRHPDRIFMAPGAPNQKLRTNALEQRVAEHPRGVILLCEGSRFAEAIAFDEESGAARIGDRSLALEAIRPFTLGRHAIGLYRYSSSQ